ncbi:MAG: arginase family protein [Chitinophagaceae bacterium]|nr:arginase family protein [Chitinophagaceae bacterium]
MNNYKEIFNYLSPVHIKEILDYDWKEQQIGSKISIIHENNIDIDEADVVIIGCGEFRSQNRNASYNDGPDKIREELYKLFYWHYDIKIADLGNIIEGNTLEDTRSALKIVLIELERLGKRVLILGGSHDLTLQQYEVYKSKKEIIDFSIVDMLVDIDQKENLHYDSYLMEALTSTPNFIRHFSLFGFQSYYVNPNVIETLDRLHFDCVRVGKAREDIEQIEPQLRQSKIASIDINAIRYSDAPANKTGSPNGFYGDEMCKITRYAGLSDEMKSLGIYGYQSEFDTENITAKLISQMIWYYIDGVQLLKKEAPFEEKENYLEYHISFTDVETYFLKSKKTNRWWMQLPNKIYIACTYQDYLSACNNEIPERWLRAMDQIV